MKKEISYKVTEGESGKTLEKILKQSLELSSAEISQAKFRTPGIRIGGMPAKVTARVTAGDLVEVCLEEEETGSDQLIPKPGTLEILYEDEDVLVVNKPAGLVCHPVGGHYRDTLANVMQYYFQERGQQVVIRMIGRLDQETSGVVLAAKSQAAASRLNRQQEQGTLKKEYLALVDGCPADMRGIVEKPIGQAGSSQEDGVKTREAIKMQVTEAGKHACTHYEVLAHYGKNSLVGLWLETGRTHQIRVHMAFLGCPLLGDTLYNPGGSNSFTRAALHAGKLEFRQPFTKEAICIEAPYPEDFTNYFREVAKISP